jgi:hypothetical protein
MLWCTYGKGQILVVGPPIHDVLPLTINGYAASMPIEASESVFNKLESCVAEVAEAGLDRAPSGSTISGARVAVAA